MLSRPVDVVVKADPIEGFAAYNWQLLINELRLLDYRVGVCGSLYVSGDVDITDDLDIMNECRLIISSQPVDYKKDSLLLYADAKTDYRAVKAHSKQSVIIVHAAEFDLIVKRADDYLKKVVVDLGYPDAATLWKDKSIQLLRDKLGIHNKVIVIKDAASTLIMTDYGNEYTAIPGATELLANVAGAAVKIISSGMAKADPIEQLNRKNTCDHCDYRVNDRCADCGCWLDEKRSYESSSCPRSLW